MAKLRTDVYVHLADTFPARTHDSHIGVDLDINIQPAAQVLRFNKKPGDLVSVFDLTIDDSTKLGLSAAPTGAEAEAALRDLVLALNLESEHGVFVLSQNVPAQFQIVHDPLNEAAKVERDADGHIHVTVSETVRVSDHVGAVIGRRLDTVEANVMALYGRIRKVRATGDREWLEALDRFEEGTTSMNRLTAVQKYAMTLDKLANLGRATDLKGADLDSEIARLSGASAKTAEHIRVLYNKTKHSVGRPADQKFLLVALQNISQTAQAAKQMAANVIKTKLPV